MDAPPGAGRGLVPVTFLLGCSLLLCSGARLPPSYPPNRLWTRDAPQDPADPASRPPAWDLQLPSISLQDWSLRMLSGEGRSRKSRLWSGPSQEVPPAELAPGWGGKRSIVVADDAAFRERSKMLTAMERQKWLNSYMQKLLVVNPD
ncbi:tuberoinfundibular peptide of 39 residues [Gopherus flavomarginatus]|uniref:tuberoinfundibular peptide of 39 residues n=1 Tax=Gopherus flavomarginatus TaxID=286002 RepID=UPI0021CC45C1|nr:tuberoinfundibular peptide of 39 residues [Gopherus flavomarginatus]